LPKFLIQSAILKTKENAKSCAEGAAKMLARGKVQGIEAKACYCCEQENRAAFLIEGPSQAAVLETMQEHLNIPIASITEVSDIS
jgi:hypothetical protein